jgi:disulfide bond formation protein DsbB
MGSSDGGRLILLLDGLNQIQGEAADRHVHFLPPDFPEQAVVIASALDGPALVLCDQVSWAFLGLSMASWNAILSALLVLVWLRAARARS